MKTNTFVLLSLLFFILACQTNKEDQIKSVSKFSDSDAFKNTMVESQLFTVNLDENNTIESKKGKLLVIPEGAFLDGDGDIVEGEVEIEFAEAKQPDEMILSNLVLMDSAKTIETHLAFYINANKNGKQLRINPENPVYIEISSDKRIDLYKTSRDASGNMKLESKLETVKYLIPVPLEGIDFLPPGFEQEVETGLPFRGHTTLTKDFVDSLYYSFTEEYIRLKLDSIKMGVVGASPMKIINNITIYPEFKKNCSKEINFSKTSKDFGINPASIKAIRNKKFENTLIATREFESRLKSIFATCKDEILELYVNNLDKNLWEIDEMAAQKLGSSHKMYPKFKEFASYKQTRVELSDKRAKFLAIYYQKEKAKTEKEIQMLRDEFQNKRQKQEKISQKKKEEYSKLLEKRLEYRMDKFGFELTEVGWYNAAEVITIDDLEKFELNVSIDNGNKFDRVYTYVINPKIQSIFSLLSDDKIHFDKEFYEDPYLLLWKNQQFKVLAVGYKGDSIAYKIQEYQQQPVINVNMQLVASDIKNLKKDFKQFTRFYTRENKVSVDLGYQEFFNKEKIKMEEEVEEEKFLYRLRKFVFPCRSPLYRKDISLNCIKTSEALILFSSIFDVSFITKDQSINDWIWCCAYRNITIEEVINIFVSTFDLEYKYENGTCEFYKPPKTK